MRPAPVDRDCFHGYGPKPLPDDLDHFLSGLMKDDAFLLSVAASDAVATDLDARILSAFAERAASLAVRTSDSTWIVAGLRAVAIALNGGDTRDHLPALSLLCDAITRMGGDPTTILHEVACDLPGEFSQGLAAFTMRSPADQSIAGMGYDAGMDEGGFRYIRNW